jgi:hypothetical protein
MPARSTKPAAVDPKPTTPAQDHPAAATMNKIDLFTYTKEDWDEIVRVVEKGLGCDAGRIRGLTISRVRTSQLSPRERRARVAIPGRSHSIYYSSRPHARCMSTRALEHSATRVLRSSLRLTTASSFQHPPTS